MGVKTDPQLLQAYVDQGDRSAIDELVARHYPHVFQVALRLVHNEFDARDVAQNVFVKALDRADQVRDRTRFRGWLLRVTVNEVRMFWRRRKPATPLDELQLVFEEARDDSVDRKASRREFELELEKALERMPAKLKLPLVLHYYQSLSLAEVAAILELPKSTVQHRVTKAVARLRRRFAKHNGVVLLPLLASSFPTIPTAQLAAGPAAVGVTTGGLLAVNSKLALAAIAVAVLLIAGLGITLLLPDASEPAPIETSGSPVDSAPSTPPSDGTLAGRATSAPVTQARGATPREARVETRGPCRITGRVLSAATREGIGGARVVVCVPTARGDDVLMGLHDAVHTNTYWTDAEGRFRCDQLPRESGYSVVVTHPDFAYAEISGISIPAHTKVTDAGAILLRGSTQLRGRVMDARGHPIAGVLVQAGSPHDHPMPLSFSYRGAALRGPSATTGVDGRFTLHQMSPGYHRVWARKAGHATMAVRHARVPASAELVLRMARARPLRGVVQTPAGEPIAGIAVRVKLQQSIRAGRQGWVAATDWRTLETDAAGRFRVDDLPVGIGFDPALVIDSPHYEQLWRELRGIPSEALTLTLRPVSAPDGQPLTIRFRPTDGTARHGFEGVAEISGDIEEVPLGISVPIDSATGTAVFPAVPPGTHEVSVTLRGYMRTNATVTMGHSAREHTLDLTRGAVARGRVIDAVTGDPIPGAHVRNGSINFAESDDAGRFELWGLRGGRAQFGAVSAEAPGYLRKGVSLPFKRDADSVDIEVVLQPTSALLTLKGRVVDPDGVGVAGAEVGVSLTGGKVYHRRARTDDAGHFKFPAVNPEHLPDVMQLRVHHTQFARSIRDLTRAQARTAIVVALTRGRTLKGRVLDQRGEPVADASVGVIATSTLGPLDGAQLTQDNIERWAYGLLPYLSGTAQTDATGRFTLTQMPTDAVQVFAFHPMTTWLVEGGRTGAEVGVGAGDVAELEVRLRRGYRLAGTIRAPDGTPVPGMRVNAEGVHIAALTDALGRFDLSPVFRDETVVRARSKHYSVELATPSDQAADLRLDALPHAPLQGRIVDESGRPLAGVVLRAASPLGEKRATTGADGAFALGGVQIGTQTLQIEHEGSTTTTTVTVQHMRPNDVGDITLR